MRRHVLFLFCLLCLATMQWQCSGAKEPTHEKGTVNQPDSGGNFTDTPSNQSDENTTSDESPKNTTLKIVINEVAPAGSPADWFELYNAGKEDADISGFGVTDDLQDKSKATFPEGTVLKAGEHKIFFFNDTWPGFGLGKEESLGIFDKDGNLVDSVSWKNGDAPAGKSYGRFPDKSGDFKTLHKPTPGTPNVDDPAPEKPNDPEKPADPEKPNNSEKPSNPDAGPGEMVQSEATPEQSTNPETTAPEQGTKGKLVINEIAAAGDPDDWFELYNGTGQTIDISKYTFTDDTKDKTKGKFEKNTELKPGEYKVFYLTSKWPGFKLGKEEELAVYDDKGNLIDSVKWKDGDSPDKKSFGRMPDQTGPFKTLNPTPGKANK